MECSKALSTLNGRDFCGSVLKVALKGDCEGCVRKDKQIQNLMVNYKVLEGSIEHKINQANTALKIENGKLQAQYSLVSKQMEELRVNKPLEKTSRLNLYEDQIKAFIQQQKQAAEGEILTRIQSDAKEVKQSSEKLAQLEEKTTQLFERVSDLPSKSDVENLVRKVGDMELKLSVLQQTLTQYKDTSFSFLTRLSSVETSIGEYKPLYSMNNKMKEFFNKVDSEAALLKEQISSIQVELKNKDLKKGYF